MPVGTQGTVKAQTPWDLEEAGASLILANAFHLYLRPGQEVIQTMGGLHAFMGWSHPILTDSGGYQIFSLRELCKIEEEGARVRSPHDGTPLYFTPEEVVRFQQTLGSDVMMVLDQCLPYPATPKQNEEATRRTLVWARRSLQAWTRRELALFAVVQGGADEALRRACAQELGTLPFSGFAVGGLSVGEPQEVMLAMTACSTAVLPPDKPRYLMGVGKPEEIVSAVEQGIDLFDCILPTRLGRSGTAFTWEGKLHVKSAAYRTDPTPLDPDCRCRTCSTFSRAYLRHLYKAEEILVMMLVTHHNLCFYLELMRRLRRAILEDAFAAFKRDFFARYRVG